MCFSTRTFFWQSFWESFAIPLRLNNDSNSQSVFCDFCVYAVCGKALALESTTGGFFLGSLFFENGKCYGVSHKTRSFLCVGVKAQTGFR